MKIMLVLSTLALLATVHAGSQAGADLANVNERMKLFDVAWSHTTDTAARTKASSLMAQGLAQLSSSSSKAAKLIDMGTAALEGRKIGASDSINIRVLEPIAEPSSKVTLVISWAYPLDTPRNVQVATCGQTADLAPGKEARLTVDPVISQPELKLNPEAGTLLPVRVGPLVRYVYLNFVRNAKARATGLAAAPGSLPALWGKTILQAFGSSNVEPDTPYLAMLFQGEGLSSGRQKVSDFDGLPLVVQGQSTFRVNIPRVFRWKSGVPVNVVFGKPPSWGNEGTYFDLFGRGRAAMLASRRNWVFVGLGPNASVDDARTWLENERKLQVAKSFVIAVQSESEPLSPRGGAKMDVRGTFKGNMLYIDTGADHPEAVASSSGDGFTTVTQELSVIYSAFDKAIRP